MIDSAKASESLSIKKMKDNGLIEKIFEKAVWEIKKFANDDDVLANKPFEVATIDGNLLLNEGINLVWDLVAGAGGTDFGNSNAYLGVGDSDTAAAATQTGLQAAVNKLYKAMEAGYPTSGTSQQIAFKSSFGSSEANFAWKEFTVANGNSDSGTNLNRKVSDQGTKVSGQTWELTLTITLS